MWKLSPPCLSLSSVPFNSLKLMVRLLICSVLLQCIDEPIDLLSGWCLDSVAVLKSVDVLLVAALADPLSVVFGQVLQSQVLVLLAAPLKKSFERLQIILAEELLDLTVSGDLSDLVKILFVRLDPVVDWGVVVGGKD